MMNIQNEQQLQLDILLCVEFVFLFFSSKNNVVDEIDDDDIVHEVDVHECTKPKIRKNV